VLGRRQFLLRLVGGLAAAAVAPSLDLEKLLWIPGEKKILLPPVAEFGALDLGWYADEALHALQREMNRLNSALLDSCLLDPAASKVGHTTLVPRRAPFVPYGPTDLMVRTDAVVHTSQWCFEPNPAIRPLDRYDARKRLIEPAMRAMAFVTTAKGLNTFGELALPVTGCEAARASDPAAGLSVRVVRLYDLSRDGERLYFDVLGGKR
jgi:hypothetical protein